MGQTAPRGTKSADELEGGQGVTVAHVPESRDDIEVQEPVFGSPIETPGYSIPNAADVMKTGIETLNILAGLQEDEKEQAAAHRSIPIVFRWDSGGNEVYICGNFNDWETKIPMTNSHGDFTAIVDLPEGRHEYKFFVDGQWLHDPKEECSDNGLGTFNNVVTVTKRDFDVYFETQELTSPDKGGSSPQGSYDHIMPPRSATSGLPPHLPPLLQQTVLNQEPPSLVFRVVWGKPNGNVSFILKEDPNLLVEPNHVILNHLYALSIKDNVLVLAATHRFQQKYITTLVYKPI